MKTFVMLSNGQTLFVDETKVDDVRAAIESAKPGLVAINDSEEIVVGHIVGLTRGKGSEWSFGSGRTSGP
jgi:hypothetical protein